MTTRPATLKQLSCDWCGRDGASNKLSTLGGEIACKRGFGCARRLPHEERPSQRAREPGSTGPLHATEYLLEGHWYTVRELADVASVSRTVVEHRIKRCWPMADVVAPLQRIGAKKRYANKLQAHRVLHERRKSLTVLSGCAQ